MSSIAKRIAKKQAFSQLMFPTDMYNNLYGSIVVCGYIFSKDKPAKEDIIKKWHKVCKSKGKEITWGIDDKDFIDKTLDVFGMKRPEHFPVAFVQSSANCLVAPFVNGQVLPLREDGYIGFTLANGKAYPLSFNEEVKKNA